MANEVALLDHVVNAVVVYERQGGVQDILTKLRNEAMQRAAGLEISTVKGRSAIKSLAYDIARSKTHLDDLGKDMVAGLKEQAAKVDADRRIIRDACDALRDEIRRPVTEWEDADKARIAAHEAALQQIIDCGLYDSSAHFSSREIGERIERLQVLAKSGRDWQEFAQRARSSAISAHDSLKAAYSAALDWEKTEADRQEAEHLAAEQRQREHDERVAREAREKAEREAAETAERERKRVERERQAAAERLEREKAKREADKKAAAERLEREKETAAQRERDRIAKEQERERAAAERREASERNRARVKKAAVAAMGTHMISHDMALRDQICGEIFDAIANGLIPSVKVEW